MLQNRTTTGGPMHAGRGEQGAAPSSATRELVEDIAGYRPTAMPHSQLDRDRREVDAEREPPLRMSVRLS